MEQKRSEMPPCGVEPEYRIVYAKPKKIQRAIEVSWSIGEQILPNLTSEVLRHVPPGLHGDVLDDLAVVVVYEREAQRCRVDHRRAPQNAADQRGFIDWQ